MRARFVSPILTLGLTLLAALGCGTDTTGLKPGLQPVQPDRIDGGTNLPPVRPDATMPPASPAVDASAPSVDAQRPDDAPRPVDPPAPREPGPEPSSPPADTGAPMPGCAEGLTTCGLTDGGAPACVSLANDEDNCGACGRRCAGDQACVAGACGCGQGQTNCGGLCVNLQTEPAHCGACGRACLPGQFCTQGRCSVGCDPGLSVCGHACVDLQTNPRHCGTCNTVCKGKLLCMRGVCGDRSGPNPGPN